MSATTLDLRQPDTHEPTSGRSYPLSVSSGSRSLVFRGDCRVILQEIASESVQCCVTSPPYWGLRDYGHADQIGLEPTPEAFVEMLTGVFREVRRVMKADGTLWLNMGDTYNNRRRLRSTSHQPSLNGREEKSWAEATREGKTRMTVTHAGWKEKDLMGIPWMVAQALRADGWYLRQEIIWQKSFGKPEPTRDRLPTRHESIFLLSKSKRYLFNRDALPAWVKDSVWQIPPTGRSDHGASFSEKLPLACILAGSKPNDIVLDPFAGSGTTGRVADRIGRSAWMIELNDGYANLCENAQADL